MVVKMGMLQIITPEAKLRYLCSVIVMFVLFKHNFSMLVKQHHT